MWNYPEEAPEKLAPLALAYVGDAVFELYIRTWLLQKGGKPNRLHQNAVKLVKAEAMAQYYHALEPLLQDKELEVLRRGRNAKSRHPRNADIQAYHMSTGFEALLGYLFLSHQEERIAQLLKYLLIDCEGLEEHEKK
jgi:ribonuclease-3 family protein